MKDDEAHSHHPAPRLHGESVMPPKHSRPLVRTLSSSSASSSQPASSTRTKKLKQNKLDFSFHSTTSSTLGSRPLTKTPSFSLPSANKGKEKANDTLQHQVSPPPKAQTVQQSTAPDDGTFLWSERLAPQSSEELAVHPRKVAQVRTWLEEAFSYKPALARHRKLLALTGPAGSAKSATIKALASPADLDYDILEWHNDTPSFDPASAFLPGSSFVDRFTEFLSKAAKFPSLQLQSSSHADNDDSSVDATASSSWQTLDSSAAGAAKRNRLILLQDLPNLHHAPTRSLFQAALEQHLAQSAMLTSSGVPNVPIVIIVTESAPREDEDGWVAGASSTTWRERIASIVDARTVLGERIRRNPAYAEVRYNPVAPSIVLKGLKRAIEHAPAQLLGKSRSKSKTTLPKPILDLLNAIANDANGDLRAALNCLQFLGASRHQLEHMAKEAADKAGRRRARGARRIFSLVAGRESSLALFHALGRVLYNKREGDPGDDAASTAADSYAEDDAGTDSDDDAEQAELQRRLRRAMHSIVEAGSSPSQAAWKLPAHLSHMDRRTSRVNVDQLWADLPVDASLFALYLHQNAVQFCTDVEQCDAVEEAFSAADTMTPLHEQYRHSAIVAYYAFAIATRGVLLGLPSPVPRQGQKLGKAAWWDVHKKLAEVMRAVEEVRMPSAVSRRPALGDEHDAGPRLRRTQFGQPATGVNGFDRADAGFGDEAVSSVVSTSNAVTLLTEVLPLLAKIRPGGTAEQLCRLRFDRAGVADIASGIMDQHDTGLDATEQEEPTPQDERQSKKIKLQDVRDQEPDSVDAGELSDDQIAEF